jgi:flagellar protein FliS
VANVYQQYRQTSIQTASPEQLVLMLYDGIVRFLEQSKQALLDGKDVAEPIGRAQDIIVELLSSLNREAGGDVATNLARLYDFWLQWLFQAQLKKNTQKIDEVLGMVREIREGWVAVVQQRKGTSPVASGAIPTLNARG